MHLIPPPPFQILRNLWFSFLLGITAVPREIEDGAHANSLFFGGGGGGGGGSKKGTLWEICKLRIYLFIFKLQ